MTDITLEILRPDIPQAQIHFSANALVSALAGGPNAYPEIDELPIQTLLGFALSNNPWLGTKVFGFPNDLHFRTPSTNGLADVSGYSTVTDWSPSKSPTVQIQVLPDVDLSNGLQLGIHLDWYALAQEDSTTPDAQGVPVHHLIVMTPAEKAPTAREMISIWARTESRWQVISYEDVLERLESAGITELEAGQAQTLMHIMIRP